MRLLIRLLINALIILLIAAYLPGFHVASFFTAIIVAIVLGIINVTLKPLLIILTLPINILSLGLFTFVINASLLLLTAGVIKGFDIAGFWPALVASLIISIIHILTRRLEAKPLPL
jgi:putative membrane protein